MKISIIGAGIGGLTAAVSLLRQGHKVQVYEQSAELKEVGAAIQMSANATKVLFHLGLKPILEAVGVKPNSFDFRRFDDGELLHQIELGDKHEAKFGVPYYQIHRGDLHAALFEQVQLLDPTAVQLGYRAESVVETDQAIEVRFSNGKIVASDLLIGADGIKSVIRQHVIDTEPPVFTGQVAWRLAIPTERIPKELRPPLASTIWCGPQNHAVMYYMRRGELINFVGCVERPWEEESWILNRPWSELDQDYAGWHPMVRAVIEHAEKDECYRWSLNNRKPITTWSTPRVTLLGDAVHPTLPYMAQGAAMAIEDAAVLARALELAMPLNEQLCVYQQHRAPRTERVVLESTQMGDLYHIADADAMREAFKERNIAASRNNWLYPYDPLQVSLM